VPSDCTVLIPSIVEIVHVNKQFKWHLHAHAPHREIKSFFPPYSIPTPQEPELVFKLLDNSNTTAHPAITKLYIDGKCEADSVTDP
jgi:hypothetical protein